MDDDMTHRDGWLLGVLDVGVLRMDLGVFCGVGIYNI